MKIFVFLLSAVVSLHWSALACAAPAQNLDMRALQVNAWKQTEQLRTKAQAEKEVARQEAAASRAKITGDRVSLNGEIVRLENEVRSLENSVTSLTDESKELDAREAELIEKVNEADGVVRELVGVVRIHAKDLQGVLSGSLQTAINGDDLRFLEEIANTSRFPGLTDITRMNDLVRSQVASGGAVRLITGPIVDRAGNSVTADILVLGNFTAAYRLGSEVGFLNYSSSEHKLFALSRLPTREQQKQLLSYMNGESEKVPVDISRGAAIAQMTLAPTLRSQILSGGPLVWPILAILAVGLLIVVERAVYLLRSRTNVDGFFNKISFSARRGDWPACKKECEQLTAKPIARVISAGLAYIGMQRETMENALQEAILKEVLPMERFLSTLAMLAAIAPLLGLLGTVTGMINTFHVITQYGTGDPRMMSGGISIALVTTMLGLGVAIPIMLLHTLLNRAIDKRIAVLEEKAVALVNLADRYQHESL